MADNHYSTAGVAPVKPQPMTPPRKQPLKFCMLSVENTISFETILMEVMHV
ncbi:MAG: hypothetical protein HOJ50_12420 [Proteobacteria bacterium]|jgi:hypothetical protein|nr:hypothetical protein [Pseudomonadota bacterium]MCH1521885.1 hypothetical protein [Arenicellales bacterium]